MQLAEIDKLRLRLRKRQRALLKALLLAPDGWALIAPIDETKRNTGNYPAARRLENLGLVRIEIRFVEGRLRRGVVLTEFGDRVCRRFCRQVIFGGAMRSWSFRQRLKQELTVFAAAEGGGTMRMTGVEISKGGASPGFEPGWSRRVSGDVRR